MPDPFPDPARAVYEALERLGIQYDVHEHPPLAENVAKARLEDLIKREGKLR